VQFEKDSRTRSVRLVRAMGLNAVPASAGPVPVVEMGALQAAQTRAQALAANES
jgi:hypothetical protein